MTIYGKGCISNYRNCSLSYVWYSVLYRMLTDNWKNDVEGAKNVGMGNVYYNIKGERGLPFKPGFDMRDWQDIASFL